MKAFFIDGASGGSGWGVAKVDTVAVTSDNTQTISIVDLGLTSVDDYIVLFYGRNTESGTADFDANYSDYIRILDKNIQSFTLKNVYPYPGATISVSYAVIAKGYGGGGGGGSCDCPIVEFEGTTGLYAPDDREPRQVGNYSLLITDAKGVNMGANRSFAVVSGYGLTCQSAAPGTTTYRITNTYQNRIIAKVCEGGFVSKNEATSTVERIVPVVSVTINGQAFTPDSSANDNSNPIEITVQESANPDETITNIRLFGTMRSYATAHIGNGVRSNDGGRSLMLGGGISKVGTGNDICVVGNAIYTSGNGNALFGRNHISAKNRWLIAGTGHDNTNGISEAGAVFGQYADIQSDTAFAVGNGTSHTARSNLFEIKTNGDVYVNGVKKL